MRIWLTDWQDDVNNYLNSNPWITVVILLLIVAAGVGCWRRYGKKNGLSWPVYGTYFSAAIVTFQITIQISEAFELFFPDNYIVGTVILTNLINIIKVVTLSMYISLYFKAKSLLNKINEQNLEKI